MRTKRVSTCRIKKPATPRVGGRSRERRGAGCGEAGRGKSRWVEAGSGGAGRARRGEAGRSGSERREAVRPGYDLLFRFSNDERNRSGRFFGRTSVFNLMHNYFIQNPDTHWIPTELFAQETSLPRTLQSIEETSPERLSRSTNKRNHM